MTKVALIVGATGLVGGNLAAHLASLDGWRVLGLSRRPPASMADVEHVACDLLDAAECRANRALVANVTHVFYATWTRRDTESENRRVNSAMFNNLMTLLEESDALEHVALVTGTKHYLGPFEAFGRHDPSVLSPFVETMSRQDVENYYYDLEDLLYSRADDRGFSWSVARPNTVVGYGGGEGMNMGLTLALYATLCKHTGRPFVFPGGPEQYYGLSDISDARLLACHLVWEATEPGAANLAFNVVNGDMFRWVAMWEHVAAYFGLEPAPYPGHPTPLTEQMANAAVAWRHIAEEHGLREVELQRLASWWHTDADLGRKVECLNSMNRSRSLGFKGFQDSAAMFTETFDAYRRGRYIP